MLFNENTLSELVDDIVDEVADYFRQDCPDEKWMYFARDISGLRHYFLQHRQEVMGDTRRARLKSLVEQLPDAQRRKLYRELEIGTCYDCGAVDAQEE